MRQLRLAIVSVVSAGDERRCFPEGVACRFPNQPTGLFLFGLKAQLLVEKTRLAAELLAFGGEYRCLKSILK